MHHTPVAGSNGTRTRPVAIEVGGQPLGVVVSAPEGFRFLAVRFNAFGIDGQVFPSVEAAQLAATAMLGQRSPD